MIVRKYSVACLFSANVQQVLVVPTSSTAVLKLRAHFLKLSNAA